MKTAKIWSPAEMAYRSMWQTRALLACKDSAGRYNRTGALMIAMLGHAQSDGQPQFSGLASITSDGYVLCDFTDRNGNQHSGAFVGSISDLIGNFRALADHIKCTDDERVEMFTMVQKWIGADYRANKKLF